jgi:hypothetical protein
MTVHLPEPGAMDLDGLLGVLARDGVLLLADAGLPSVTSLVAGEPIRGSWWGHPRGGEIYHLSNQLGDHPDVLTVKLVSAKVTFAHRRLWPAVVSVGQSREAWQMDGLSEVCLELLRLVDESGQLAWDEVPPFLQPDGRLPTAAIRALEERLLIHAAEVHTPTGAHAKNLEAWFAWAGRVGLLSPLLDVTAARQQLEGAIDDLNDRFEARATLPWQSRSRRGTGVGRVRRTLRPAAQSG